jgi:energy-converting hydrogenase Eha subunit H
LSALTFGALALLASLPSKLFGSTALIIAVYISVTELRSFSKAVRD